MTAEGLSIRVDVRFVADDAGIAVWKIRIVRAFATLFGVRLFMQTKVGNLPWQEVP